MSAPFKIRFSDGSEAAEVETVGHIKPEKGFVIMQFTYKPSGLAMGSPFPMKQSEIDRQIKDGRLKLISNEPSNTKPE